MDAREKELLLAKAGLLVKEISRSIPKVIVDFTDVWLELDNELLAEKMSVCYLFALDKFNQNPTERKDQFEDVLELMGIFCLLGIVDLETYLNLLKKSEEYNFLDVGKVDTSSFRTG